MIMYEHQIENMEDIDLRFANDIANSNANVNADANINAKKTGGASSSYTNSC